MQDGTAGAARSILVGTGYDFRLRRGSLFARYMAELDQVLLQRAVREIGLTGGRNPHRI